MPPIFSIPSCVFIGPLGNTNVGGRLTSQEDANLHVRISKNSRGVGVVVVKSVHVHMFKLKDSKKWLEVGCPPGNNYPVIT